MNIQSVLGHPQETNINYFVSRVDYDALKNENICLKAQVAELLRIIQSHQESHNEVMIKQIAYKQTIEELKRENENLKQDIVMLKREVAEQNVKLARQDAKIAEQVQRIDFLMNKDLINNLCIALQDLNRTYTLETKLERKYASKLKKIRINRNDMCHFIQPEEIDFQDLKKRQKVWIDFVLGLNPDIRSMLDKKCGGHDTIDAVIEYLMTHEYQVDILTKQEYDDIASWFDG